MKSSSNRLCFVVTLVATLLFSSNLAFADDGPLTLNTTHLGFTISEVNPGEGSMVVRAFVPTRSASAHCLVTLSEANFFPTPNAVFCAPRQPAAFGGITGILVSVFLPQPAAADFFLSVTLWQEGATRYGAPVLCTSADGC